MKIRYIILLVATTALSSPPTNTVPLTVLQRLDQLEKYAFGRTYGPVKPNLPTVPGRILAARTNVVNKTNSAQVIKRK